MSSALSECFAKSRAVGIDDLKAGKYMVVAGDGVPEIYGHIKVFYRKDGILHGYNKSVIRWGRFKVCHEGESMAFDYSISRIPWLKTVRDHMRVVSPGILVGLYERKGLGRGYFMLVKI